MTPCTILDEQPASSCATLSPGPGGKEMPGLRDRLRTPAMVVGLAAFLAPFLYGLWCMGWYAAIPVAALTIGILLTPTDPMREDA